MNNKKKLIFSSISIIALLVIVSFGYKYLTSEYKPKDITSSKPSISQESTSKDSSISKNSNTQSSDSISATDFTVYNINGEKVNLSDYKGKKSVVINFWASWCPHCKFEMPFFQSASKKYSTDDVEILMVNLTDGRRETKEKALKHIQENNYTMTVLFDEDLNGANAYSIRSIPRTIFVDKNGNLFKDHTGIISEDALNEDIENLIKIK
ncbi:TlpA disulfide reductase family protein [Clostridium carnis]